MGMRPSSSSLAYMFTLAAFGGMDLAYTERRIAKINRDRSKEHCATCDKIIPRGKPGRTCPTCRNNNVPTN